MTNTNTTRSAAEQLAANVAKAEHYEADRLRAATEFHEADARITAGSYTADDLDAVADNEARAQALAARVRQLQAERPHLERAVRLEEAEEWAASLRDQMPEGTTARAEAIRQRAAEVIADAIAQAREELEEVARFGMAAEAQGYKYSQANLAPAGLHRMSSRDSGVLLDGISYGRVSASNVGEELGARVDREHAAERNAARVAEQATAR